MANDDDILAELKKISSLLAKPPEPPKPKGMAQEFKAFIENYKVLGLAVAFIIGVYLGNLVKALVTDLILPVVSFALPPGSNFNTYTFHGFGIGDFTNNLLTFIIVAFVIFLIVKAANKYNIS